MTRVSHVTCLTLCLCVCACQKEPTGEPVAEKPTKPVAEKAAQPVTEKPIEPVVEKPGEPVAEKPKETDRSGVLTKPSGGKVLFDSFVGLTLRGDWQPVRGKLCLHNKDFNPLNPETMKATELPLADIAKVIFRESGTVEVSFVDGSTKTYRNRTVGFYVREKGSTTIHQAIGWGAGEVAFD